MVYGGALVSTNDDESPNSGDMSALVQFRVQDLRGEAQDHIPAIETRGDIS